MVERQLPKLDTRVRFPSPALPFSLSDLRVLRAFSCHFQNKSQNRVMVAHDVLRRCSKLVYPLSANHSAWVAGATTLTWHVLQSTRLLKRRLFIRQKATTFRSTSTLHFWQADLEARCKGVLLGSLVGILGRYKGVSRFATSKALLLSTICGGSRASFESDLPAQEMDEKLSVF